MDNETVKIATPTLCRCAGCGKIFNYNERKVVGLDIYGKSPCCNKSHSVIQFQRMSDEIYMNRLSEQYS